MSQKKVNVGNIKCGADQMFLISGPCVIEEESIMMKVAEQLKKITERLDLPLIYKSSFQKDNRSSVEYYMGPGLEKGLRALEKIKNEFDVPILTDIHYPDQVKPAADVVDIIQIPAYLIMQTNLVVEAAKKMTKVYLDIEGPLEDPKIHTRPLKRITEPVKSKEAK